VKMVHFLGLHKNGSLFFKTKEISGPILLRAINNMIV
jgi:hypothetical protein